MALGCVTVVWLVAVFGSFRYATRELGEWEDARLVEYASLLVDLSPADLDRLARFPPDARVELDRRNARSGPETDGDRLPRDVLFEVRDAQGHVVASSLPAEAAGLPDTRNPRGTPETIVIHDAPWRTHTLRNDASGRWIRVMEIVNTRSDLATGIARGIVLPLIVALPVLALLLWYLIGRGLAPLKTLSALIGARDARSLEPLGIATVPDEVRTLVDAIDRLLARLRQSIVRERAFTSDAAHELKTPLAAIKVQAQVAIATGDPARQQLAMQRVVQGVDRSARLADQLLLLARLDEYERIPTRAVIVRELVDAAIDRHLAKASDKPIDLVADDVSGRAIDADPILIGILLDNLVDNAIKYGRDGGRIELAVHDDGARQRIVVRDDGPGVAPGEHERLGDRFYRGTGAQSPGSGLGLSIVTRITQYFGGTVQFGAGIGGQGLGVAITLPSVDADGSAPAGTPDDGSSRAMPRA
ncbi:ATP-binding protein [Burkholderia lata]|uniref:histidine kinase n=1 Tax=Burkholderia lata (strain ATCC 17760 / DSM 23089 / LMG 22485 / NCIMB 9086 / R18194 / 383) TaxID=482957 RepID=A0A6P2TS68_BURL3|nr:ATP-binding protein [Burkholderia lata]VWC66884.1 histidine kinase [Burkholderia lata]